MKLLQEIINPNTVNLTNIQQAVLIIVKIAPTPAVAYETSNGAAQAVAARNGLRTLGLIMVGGNKAVLTRNGENAVNNFNLVDGTGKPTEQGAQLLNAFNKQFNNQNKNTEAQPDVGEPTDDNADTASTGTSSTELKP